MIYEHKCQFCENIVERRFKTGIYTCFPCKRKQDREWYINVGQYKKYPKIG